MNLHRNVYFLTFILFLSGLFFSLESFAKNTNEEQLNYSFIFNKKIPSHIGQSLARRQLLEEIISTSQKKANIDKILHLSELDTESAKALLLMSIDRRFIDSLEKNLHNFTSHEYRYTAQAKVLYGLETIKNIQSKLGESLLIYRLAELEKDTEHEVKSLIENISTLEKIAKENKAEKDIDANIEAILIKISADYEIYKALEYLTNELIYYSNIHSSNAKWEEPEIIIEMIEALQNGSAKKELPTSINNILAEAYFYQGRPFKAFEVIEELKRNNKANLFTEYLNILTALDRSEVEIAKIDLQKVKKDISDKDALYPNFLVLEGAIAQLQGNIENMCEAYENACIYNNCAPFQAVQSICIKNN